MTNETTKSLSDNAEFGKRPTAIYISENRKRYGHCKVQAISCTLHYMTFIKANVYSKETNLFFTVISDAWTYVFNLFSYFNMFLTGLQERILIVTAPPSITMFNHSINQSIGIFPRKIYTLVEWHVGSSSVTGGNGLPVILIGFSDSHINLLR